MVENDLLSAPEYSKIAGEVSAMGVIVDEENGEGVGLKEGNRQSGEGKKGAWILVVESLCGD